MSGLNFLKWDLSFI